MTSAPAKRAKDGPIRTTRPATLPALEDRLYKTLARYLMRDIVNGKYAVGDRLPAERELAAEYQVSRPTVREAIIALEVRGLVEVRLGSGTYVQRVPGADDSPGFNVTAFELTEARLMFESEAAALAATQITNNELDALDHLVRQIGIDNQRTHGNDDADRDFHLAIARATRNTAVNNAIEELWRLRSSSPESALLHSKARSAQVKPVVDEHQAIAKALRSRDPAKARAAMRAHLSAVLSHLLFATEAQAVAEVRHAAQAKRERFSRWTKA
jgi:GntR family hexuronate regulon transcriptional repressor